MKKLLFAGVVLLLAAPDLLAQAYQKTLIGPDSSKDVFLDGKQFTPAGSVPWSLRLETLHGGKQEGTRLLTLSNGVLRITLVPSRGMSILDVTRQPPGKPAFRLGWESPVREVVHPAYMNLQARGGLGWLEGFNEFLCRCGLENVGQPGKDVIVTNTGAKAEVDLTLHGKIANIPASFVEVVVDPQPPHRIHIRGRVEEKMLFGPILELHTELSTEPGSAEFRVEDRVINKGGTPQEFQLLYHTNVGKPLLREGARVLAPVKQVTPFNERAAEDVKNYGQIAGPRPGYVEQVYLLRPLADEAGKTRVLIQSKDASQGVALRYDVKQLPYLTLWKNTAAEADGYVIGVEPGTSYPNPRRVERQQGRVPKLAPGETYRAVLDFAVLTTPEDVRRVAEEIRTLQQTHPARIDAKPEGR